MIAGMRSDALRAVTDVVLGLAGEPGLEPVLERLVHAVRDLAGARYAALGIPDEDGTGFDRFITSGMSDDLIDAIGPLPLPRTHGLLAAMLTDPRPYRTEDIRADPRFEWWPEAHPRMRSFLGVPLLFKGDIVGAFYLTDKDGGFDEADVGLVSGLAAHAAVVIENARLFDASRERSVAEERSRARELVDSALAELRALIFELRPPELEADGLAGALRKHAALLSRAHGVAVTVSDLRPEGDRHGGGSVDGALFRVAEEALSNALRHSGASVVTVTLRHDGPRVVLEVADDGRGFDPAARSIAARRLGLVSMRERVEQAGGQLTIRSAPGRGTTVRAAIPRPGAAS